MACSIFALSTFTNGETDFNTFHLDFPVNSSTFASIFIINLRLQMVKKWIINLIFYLESFNWCKLIGIDAIFEVCRPKKDTKLSQELSKIQQSLAISQMNLLRVNGDSLVVLKLNCHKRYRKSNRPRSWKFNSKCVHSIPFKVWPFLLATKTTSKKSVSDSIEPYSFPPKKQKTVLLLHSYAIYVVTWKIPFRDSYGRWIASNHSISHIMKTRWIILAWCVQYQAMYKFPSFVFYFKHWEKRIGVDSSQK